MSKFHSTVSRRTFMKGLGLAGAGLGAAAAAAPVFHDLDEATASPGAQWKRAWWVKKREIGDPTLEIDWSQIKRLDQAAYAPVRYNSSSHPDAVFTKENYNRLVGEYIRSKYPEFNGDTTRDPYGDMAGNYDPPGYQPKGVRDIAANRAATEGRHPGIGFTYTPIKVKSPEEIGMAKWQGTPEENLLMVRQIFRAYGAFDIGAVQLDSNTRKLILEHDSKGKAYVFRDVDKPYETDTEKVIPNRYTTIITWSELQPTELTYRNPSTIGKVSKQLSYTRMPQIVRMMYGFLHGIGYGNVNGYSSDLAPSNPFGVLSGIGEHTRASFVVTSPEYGTMLRGMNRILTDLPVAPTNPIDAGMNKFCETCKICAENCPFGALSLDSSTWDPVQYEGNRSSPTGFKGWHTDLHKCPFCDGCQATCPFNSTKHSPIHAAGWMILGITGGNIQPLNQFMANMERTFHYGFKEPESWWDLTNEPVYGHSTTLTQ